MFTVVLAHMGVTPVVYFAVQYGRIHLVSVRTTPKPRPVVSEGGNVAHPVGLRRDGYVGHTTV